MDWTKEQKDAINKKGSNLLVAAAAGSGKTAVLVERIIQKILKEGIDIDKLLVVTFTNAAASEMRERVLEAIYKKIDEDPENENLQRQVVLLGKSNICTIHSFCLDVIKNNFFEIDLSANFRIGTEEEIELLKQEVLEDLFEKLYDEENPDFAKLVDTYTGYRGDEQLKEIVLRIYNFMQSAPFPKDWLVEKIEMFKKVEDPDFSKSPWGKILINNLQEEIIDGINNLKAIRNKLEKYYELEKYKLTIESDIELLKQVYDATFVSWDNAYKIVKDMKFATWPQNRKIVLEIKEEAKIARNAIKTKIMNTLKETLIYDSQSAYNDIYDMYEILDILKNVIIKFDNEFNYKKRERNIIDFNDIEHYALKILLKKNESGKYVPTDVAKKYQQKFEEIAIDEYQDSNKVQEFILNSVSRGNNLFMVGDVKQSIYKFRQACPELFMEKYEQYDLNGNEKGLKIQLFKNFRSRQNVLDITNRIFNSIMSKKLGNVNYNEEEFLNLGADYDEKHENILDNAELNIIDLKENEEDIFMESIGDSDETKVIENNNIKIDYLEINEKVEEDFKRLEKEELEATFISKKIQEIINSKVQVKDKKVGYRDVTYKDIVILLRSTARIAPIYEKSLLKNNIPVFSDSSNEYLDTIEIQTIINVLKIIDNPIDDISLVSVLRSEIGGFNDNEIVEIRLCNKEKSFYYSLITAKESLTGELKEKILEFLNNIEKWRKESDYLSLAELISQIYTDTGFYNYVGLMPNGSLRQANLRMLFERAKEYEKTSFKGLFNFILFIERLKNGNSDMSSAKIIGENEDVVRIMSIHKSKGLEFPIVFLASTSKKINFQDINSNLLLHQNLGIGPQYINYEKMIEYSTSAKDAIKIISKEETISEEMRVLYVALTRAKEKLIITGVCKDYKKDLEKKKELLKIYKTENKKLSPILLKKYTSYLDWILLVILNGDLNNLININEYNKKDVIVDEVKEEIEIREFDFDKEIDYKKFDEEFNWLYNENVSTRLPIKSTVSKIKELKSNQSDFENDILDFNMLNNKEIGIAEITPRFMDLEENISATRRGTVIHFFMQKIDFREDYSLEKLENLKQELISKNIITLEESKFIKINKVQEFLKSDLANKIKRSKIIEKEKAFCCKIEAKEVFKEAKNQTILVQGIIDLYAITEKNEIILVDYKTDYIEDGKEKSLIDKYYSQLKIYKNALEQALGKKVTETYIYSLFLNKDIKVLIN